MLIEQLMDDHQKILAFLNELEARLIDFMVNNTYSHQQFVEDIQFIREFADKAHHQREENGLFKIMVEYLGAPAQKLVQHGMLVEHDQARFHVRQWEAANNRYQENPTNQDKLTILAEAYGYVELLRRHIDKEDNVVYPFAQKNLSPEQIKEMESLDQAN